MPRNQKESHDREMDDEERDVADAPRVDESEVEDEERAQTSLGKRDKHEEGIYEVDDDDIAEEIDLDDLAAMEGPDRT
jgi:hypothetical protein